MSASIYRGLTESHDQDFCTARLLFVFGCFENCACFEDVFNGSIRKFLKTLGVSAQREIEKAVRQALAEGKLKGNERFPARATVTLGGIGFSHEIKGEIELE